MIEKSELLERAGQAGVVPVLTIQNANDAVPLAEALCAGGLDVLEVTLRTDAALEAIHKIAASGIQCVIGAGTILGGKDVAAARDAGAEFLVSPGTPAALIPALQAFDGVSIPGVSTATEAMTLYDAGFDVQKFFPAEPAGGAPFLKGLAGPLPNVAFMPTGGIKLDTMGAYLSLKSVVAVGGSWIAPDDAIERGAWAQITDRARKANETATAAAAG